MGFAHMKTQWFSGFLFVAHMKTQAALEISGRWPSNGYSRQCTERSWLSSQCAGSSMCMQCTLRAYLAHMLRAYFSASRGVGVKISD